MENEKIQKGDINNMSNMTLAERYSNLVDFKLRNELVLKDGVVFNNRYNGDPKAGSVNVRKSGEANVGTYNRRTGCDISYGSSEWINIPIDKDMYINELIDRYEASSIPKSLVADILDSVGFGLAQIIDKDGAKELIENGTVLEDTTALTKQTVYNRFVDARVRLDENNIPTNGRYAIVAPQIYAYIVKTDEFIRASDLGNEVVKTGAVGQIAGFTLYKSNNLGEDVEVIFGHPNYATRVEEWCVQVRVQDLAESSKYIGACAVQGRKIYAHKVTEPKGILIKKSDK